MNWEIRTGVQTRDDGGLVVRKDEEGKHGRKTFGRWHLQCWVVDWI